MSLRVIRRTDSVSGDKASSSDGFRRMLQVLFSLCPEAAPTSEPSPAKACHFEGMFSGQVRAPREDLSPLLFHRVGEIRDEIASRFQASVESGKAPVSLLPLRREMYGSADTPSLSKASPLNVALPRLVGSVVGTRSAGFTVRFSVRLWRPSQFLFVFLMQFWSG